MIMGIVVKMAHSVSGKSSSDYDDVSHALLLITDRST